MRLADTFVFHVGGQPRTIHLFEGDISTMEAADGVDVLILSAFPGDYITTPTSVVGALGARGVSVRDLASSPQYDLRRYWSVWLSRECPQDVGFRRILCYEPDVRAEGEHTVEGIFRGIGAVLGHPYSTKRVAMSVVTTGDRSERVEDVFPRILESAMDALRTTSLEYVRIVERDPKKLVTLAAVFAEFKGRNLGIPDQTHDKEIAFDVFLSYSHANWSDADFFQSTLERECPGIRVFRDVQQKRLGGSYRIKLDRAVRRSARFVPLYSPDYFRSSACKDEFNTAWGLAPTKSSFLFPLLARLRDSAGAEISAKELDGDHRKLETEYFDCVEGSSTRLAEAACFLISKLKSA